MMTAKMRQFAEDNSGATAVEYAVLAAGIAVAIAVTVGQLGEAVGGLYDKVVDAFAG